MKTKKMIRLFTLALSGSMLMLASGCKKDNQNDNTVTDIDGNEYKTVEIGGQVWMTENLRVTHYRNGDAISNITDTAGWSNTTSGAFCWYENDKAGNENPYGALYNWYAANDSRNLAPSGWHVPSKEEWLTLVSSLGGTDIAGGKMKEAGTAHWESPNTGATNESGFTAVGSGYRYNDGDFDTQLKAGGFWSTTDSADFGYHPYLRSVEAAYKSNTLYKVCGNSIRCVKD